MSVYKTVRKLIKKVIKNDKESYQMSQKTKTFSEQCLERAEKATKGPWTAINCKVFALNRPLPSMQLIAQLENIGASEDVEFIAAARTMVPELCRRLKRAVITLRHIGHVIDDKRYIELADELESAPEGEK